MSHGRRLSRIGLRVVLVLLVLTAGVVISFPLIINRIGGAFSRRPSELKTGLSSGASALVRRAFDGIAPGELIDHHTHMVGLGTSGAGAFVNPEMQSIFHPLKYVKYRVYMSAAGIQNLADADREYVQRLAELVENIEGHGRHYLLAFDKHYNADGAVNLDKTEFYTPNEYVYMIAGERPDLFRPAMSVHPYRADAAEELERWAKHGVRLVKWLPNAMGIDPSDSRCDRFYAKMKELHLTLLTHAGEEQAVDAGDDQRLGNPLLLRRPLDFGVRVIVAHCAALGDSEDLDSSDRKRVSNFQLFLRLMEDEKYQGLLFGEISAATQYNRLGALETIIRRTDLHSRLANGSDYPLPAVNIVIRTGALAKASFISAEERDHLDEIYDYNPLLFDFVLKRTMRAPGTDTRLPPSLFTADPSLHR